MSHYNNIHIIIICDYNTEISQIKFIHRNVISSEYTINEYVYNVLRQKLKKQSTSTYIMPTDITLNQYTTIIWNLVI